MRSIFERFQEHVCLSASHNSFLPCNLTSIECLFDSKLDLHHFRLPMIIFLWSNIYWYFFQLHPEYIKIAFLCCNFAWNHIFVMVLSSQLVCSCDLVWAVYSNKNTIFISITQTETPNRHESSKFIITLAPWLWQSIYSECLFDLFLSPFNSFVMRNVKQQEHQMRNHN